MSGYNQLDSGILVPATTLQPTEYRHDAWSNAQSGMGMEGIDKTLYTTYSPYNTVLSYQVLQNLYEGDWLTQKICDLPAEDATRKFIQFNDQNKMKPFMDKLKGMQAKQKTKTGIAWSRLFGGAGVVMITKLGDPEEPLQSGKNNLVDLEVYDRWDLTPVAYDMDYNSTNYMRPLIYQTYEGKRFHYTRIGMFNGKQLTRRRWIENLYWGGSFVSSVWSAIKHLQGSYEDIRYILTELNIGILKIPNLTVQNAQQGPGGAAKKVQKRTNEFNLTKSNQRVAAIDKEEEFTFVNRTVAGVNDLVNQFKAEVQGATGIPQNKLFLDDKSGLSGDQTDQDDTYEGMINGIQENQIEPFIEQLLYADGYTDAEWSFVPQKVMSDIEKANGMQTSANAIALLGEAISAEDRINALNSLEFWNLEDNSTVPDFEFDK